MLDFIAYGPIAIVDTVELRMNSGLVSVACIVKLVAIEKLCLQLVPSPVLLH